METIPLKTLVSTELKYTYELTAKLKPHGVVVNKQFWKNSTEERNVKSLENLIRNDEYNGYMSDATRRNVKGIIENWLLAIELNTKMDFLGAIKTKKDKKVWEDFSPAGIYPTFVTLTLPFKQWHDDRDIKNECLVPFVEKMRADWAVCCYLWVAETQKNGNLHFHIIFDRPIPAKRLREEWNKQIEKLDYVGDYRRMQKIHYKNGYRFSNTMLVERLEKERSKAKERNIWLTKSDIKDIADSEHKRQEKAYKKGVAEDWRNPNSTDVHSLRNLKSLTAYVCKYFTKAPEIVMPKLEPGETLVKDGGAYFIEKKVERIDEFGDSSYTDRELYKPVFVNRRMTGRIWGAANLLKDPETKPSPLKLVVEYSKIEYLTYQQKITEKKPTRIVVTDIFGNRSEKIEHREITSTYTTEEISSKGHEHAAAKSYLGKLRSEIPPGCIERATAAAGSHFASMGGQVIPLEDPQRNYLKRLAPEVWTDYEAHYRQMFLNFYPNVAA